MSNATIAPVDSPRPSNVIPFPLRPGVDERYAKPAPDNGVIRGLIVALPMSLLLWAAIIVTVRALW